MIKIQLGDFDIGSAISGMTDGKNNIGGLACFVGLVRDIASDRKIKSMTLEHYPGMTEKQLEEIVSEARQIHEILHGLLLHRIGNVHPGEDIVLIAIWATHRKDAFAACREIMEALKSKAPFWKKETLAEGDRWVENNTPDE